MKDGLSRFVGSQIVEDSFNRETKMIKKQATSDAEEQFLAALRAEEAAAATVERQAP